LQACSATPIERLVLIDRPRPVQDLASLDRSAVRDVDQTWIHNLDGMVQAASGHVGFRRWQPLNGMGDRGTYLLIAAVRSDARPPAPRALDIGFATRPAQEETQSE
jgi:hypothetical protein